MRIKFGLYDQNGDAVTGTTLLKCKVKRDADDYFYDFGDSTFKVSGHGTVASPLSEPDSTNAPGEYEKSIDASGWDDGIYTVYCNYTGSPKQNGSSEVVVTDGVEMAVMLQRLYLRSMYKLNITNLTGASALRNLDDSADVAAGSIVDDGTTTVRSKWNWS